jgi:hypothetical protein
MPSKGCWKCHAVIRRGKLCMDCLTMAVIGGLVVVGSQILTHYVGVWLK